VLALVLALVPALVPALVLASGLVSVVMLAVVVLAAGQVNSAIELLSAPMMVRGSVPALWCCRSLV